MIKEQWLKVESNEEGTREIKPTSETSVMQHIAAYAKCETYTKIEKLLIVNINGNVKYKKLEFRRGQFWLIDTDADHVWYAE